MSLATSGQLSGITGWTAASKRYAIPHLRLRQVAALVRELRPASMLDIGCSSGFLRTLCPGVAYTGCDFIDHPAADFPFHRVDLNHDPLPETLQDFDAVVCCGCLEYITNLPNLLTQIVSRLRPDGHLVATYYNFNHISRVSAMLAGKSFWTHPDWRGFHSPQAFENLLRAAHLDIVRRVPSRHSLGPSPRIEETVNWPLRLPRFAPWSPWTAQQIIFVAQKQR
jgi:SAM-dependent methyltransferase